MPIWMSNSRSTMAYERVFFALMCDNLLRVRGPEHVTRRFQCLTELVALPWLNQPHALEPTRLIFEIHEAWDELWQLRTSELTVRRETEEAARSLDNDDSLNHLPHADMFGRYLARPLHELAVFAASAGASSRIRVATHRELISGTQSELGWRVIHGGRSRGSALQRELALRHSL